MEAALDQPDLHIRSSDDVDPGRSDFLDSHPGCGGAKYKLLSPAKLPISRSPCLTIPPGLSPTSFLESPVLLSNMKVRFGFPRIGFPLYLFLGFLFGC